MGHVIEYHTLDRNVDRNQFIADMDEVVQAEDYLEGGYYDGRQLTWHDDTVYDTREDAEQAHTRTRTIHRRASCERAGKRIHRLRALRLPYQPRIPPVRRLPGVRP